MVISIRRGSQTLQRTLALELQHEAKVPFGPCGYDALTAFSEAPSLAHYQIILVDAHRSFHITTFGDTQDKQLILLHDHDHYDVITRLPGFFGSSYVCAHCWKPYNTQGQHRCNKNKQCGACRQKECPDFQAAYPRGQKATQRCPSCHRDFFGDTCFEMHLGKDHTGKTNPQSSVCFHRRRCPNCLNRTLDYKRLQGTNASTWSALLAMSTCTVKPIFVLFKDPQSLKKRRERGNVKEVLAPNEERPRSLKPEEEEEEEEDVDDLPPLHVFFDIEAMQPHEQHIANLIVAETEDDDQPIRFPGEYCTRDFLEWLDTLTLNDTRQVNVLAHNFQGYDGYFVVHQYHSDNRIVEQLRNGCKLLEVKHDRIRFIDSLSFFQMPLSAFPKTFGLTELKKGYFPHKFNIPEHQTYVGIVPALDYYMPETMSPEGKQALEKWHQEQRANNMVFDFQKELVEYCESDVRLLKQGCLTFKRLFEAQAGFNPFDHITIASACNMDLRMNRMIPNSIASEPTLGWKNRINHSNVSIEWLTWCIQEQSQDIQHARNAGEYRIPGTNFHADGYCHDTQTVYEFQGCFTHGCPTCSSKPPRKTCASL